MWRKWQQPTGRQYSLSNGYNVYINGTNNNYFECTWGDEAITADDITIKSDWNDKSKNTVVPISEFEISVVWSNEYNQEQTTLPDFWTNATGDTSNSFATTYTFTLTKGEFSTIFDGNEYTYSAEMEWCYNDRESDTSKHFSFDIENLDPEYSMQEHMQWCHVANDQFVSECKADDILDNGYIAICFTPVSSNLKWILEENEEFNIIASFQVKYYPI